MSSVYLWDLDHGFAGVILIKKAGDGSNKIKGCWDSIHVVEVQVSCASFIPTKVSFFFISASFELRLLCSVYECQLTRINSFCKDHVLISKILY